MHVVIIDSHKYMPKFLQSTWESSEYSNHAEFMQEMHVVRCQWKIINLKDASNLIEKLQYICKEIIYSKLSKIKLICSSSFSFTCWQC